MARGAAHGLLGSLTLLCVVAAASAAPLVAQQVCLSFSDLPESVRGDRFRGRDRTSQRCQTLSRRGSTATSVQYPSSGVALSETDPRRDHLYAAL